MNSKANTNTLSNISVGQAGLIAGLGLLLMVLTAPVAQMYLLPGLIDSTSATTTMQNIIANKHLLVAAIFLFMVTFLADIIVAWALYIFFRPLSWSYSLLTAWLRIVYTVMALFGLFNLSKILVLLDKDEMSLNSNSSSLAETIMFYIRSFQQEWGISFIFFGVYLVALGWLAYRANYVPKIMGVFLIIAGLGYLINSLQPYFFPGIDTSFLMITFFGELVFMVWLLIKGRQISLD